MRRQALSTLALIVLLGGPLPAQEFTVHAVEDTTGKSLAGLPITMRYNCGTYLPSHCQWITRKTGKDGIARFPEAGSLSDVDDIYCLTVPYSALADLQPHSFPGSGTMRFRKRSFSERVKWIFEGP